ncbi:MAG: extensin, partial [Candidatus Promineifilaceae bacterium]
MSRRADRFLSWLLIILSAAIFVGIVLLGVPRLLAPQPSTEVAASSIPTPIPDSAEPTPIPATLVPTDLPE